MDLKAAKAKDKNCGQDYPIKLYSYSMDQTLPFFVFTRNIMYPPLKTSAAGKD